MVYQAASLLRTFFRNLYKVILSTSRGQTIATYDATVRTFSFIIHSLKSYKIADETLLSNVSTIESHRMRNAVIK